MITPHSIIGEPAIPLKCTETKIDESEFAGFILENLIVELVLKENRHTIISEKSIFITYSLRI